MSAKYALIIGNTEYSDPGLAKLMSPGKDAEDFARVLRDQDICAFDQVNILLNEPEYQIREAIYDFFNQKKPDDLLVLYFSGHGVRDEFGALYLAVKNTNRAKLGATAVDSTYITKSMDQSRSKRQVLILDCCNSGAFSQGTKAATGMSIGTAAAFEAGYGRIILTASDATQFAWEGDKVIGETDNSLFTHYLVAGLEGAADLDGDGRITVDEVYDYAYEKVRLATPKQTPSKFSSKQQGEIVLRQSMRIEDIKPATLPAALLDTLENPYADIRLAGVQQLIKLLSGKNLGLARSAREALERIVEEDDSRTVSRTALQALESVRQAELLELQKAEEERLMAEKLEADRKAKEAEETQLEAEQRTKEEPWITKKERKAIDSQRKLKAKRPSVAKKVIRAAPTPFTTNVDKLRFEHLGREPLKDEILLFKERILRILWSRGMVAELIMTNKRLIFWDQENDQFSFEIGRAQLDRAVLYVNHLGNLSIEVANGQKFEIRTSNRSRSKELIDRIKSFP